MDTLKPTKEELSRARWLLCDPYAYIERLEEGVEQPTIFTSPSADTSSGNPYASLSSGEVKDDDPGLMQVSETVGVLVAETLPSSRVRTRSISKHDFRRLASHIFKQYVPKLEGGVLRNHHRNFLDRNEERSSNERFELLDHLRRYDLSAIVGATPHFNREPVDLTEEKLREIERLVFDSRGGK